MRFPGVAKLLVRVRLLRRMRVGKGFEGVAGLDHVRDLRIGRHVRLEADGREHLRDEIRIRNRRSVAVTKSAPVAIFAQHRLDRVKPSLAPMLNPGRNPVRILLVMVGDELPDAQIVHRMHVRSHNGGQGPYPRPPLRILGQ